MGELVYKLMIPGWNKKGLCRKDKKVRPKLSVCVCVGGVMIRYF